MQNQPPSTPAELAPALDILRHTFGYSEFRPPQDRIISTLVGGGDALVIMPTGGGKSLCYQIPALLREGTAVVISPLIALMQDQVDALRQLGIRASFLNSSLDQASQREIEQQLQRGELDLLYIAPERLNQNYTLALLKRCQIALFAIDEAHCVSQWGHDFRADYLSLSLLAEQFPQVPRIALTATADARTRAEIIERLQLERAEKFICGFDRPNIQYRISLKNNPKQQLLNFLRREHSGDCGVVYCLSRAKVEATAEWLREQGFNALAYHAGLPAHTKAEHQSRFLREDGVIIVATIAFGMGIDKPDVRFVAHLDLPKSIEAYYQETGRAGRDGEPATAWMVYSIGDVIKLKQMIEQGTGSDQHKRGEQQRLTAMLGLCEITSCRRRALLNYFEQSQAQDCGNCDTCLAPQQTFDGTEAARKALSTVYRSGQRFGVNHLIDILLGKRSDKIEQFGHHQLTTFGIGTELDANRWRSVFRQLTARGYLRVDGNYGALLLDESCRPLLRGEQTIELRRDRSPERSYRQSRRSEQLGGRDQALWNKLRALRKQLADEQGIAPYMVFHDATLMEMLSYEPVSREQMARISGVGESKLERYGDAFTALIEDHLNSSANSTSASAENSAAESLALFKAGMSATQVALQRGLAEDTVWRHLNQAIVDGQIEACEVCELAEAEVRQIEEAFFELSQSPDQLRLKPVHEHFAGEYDYNLLRAVAAGIRAGGRNA